MSALASEVDGHEKLPPPNKEADGSDFKATNASQQESTSTTEQEMKARQIQDDWSHDPSNPRNWPHGKKWIAVSIVALYSFIPPLASSMMAPALPEIALKYGITNPTVLGLTFSVLLISFAFGPLLVAPLSEMYGRTWVYHIGILFFLAFSLGCAFAPTTGAFIAFRFLSGWAGAAPIAVGGGSVSDLFAERERASAMAVWTIGPLIGPVVGPIAGGFIAQSIGVKYIFIVIAALCAVSVIIGIPFLRETYAPTISRWLAMKSSDPEMLVKHHIVFGEERGSKLHFLWLNLSRPAYMLTHSFICFILSLYMALMYGIYYLMFSTFPHIFTDMYHFSTGVSGLAYIGLGVGFSSALFFGGKIADTIYNTLADRNGGKGTPEMRVPALIFGSFFVPVGLFWYGWSTQAQLHWIMPIIGTSIFGFGLMTTYLPIQLYLTDVFAYGASALSAAGVLRSLLGFAFPLFGSQMYAKLGNGGGNSLLAGLAIVIGIPFPIWIWFKGESIRQRSTLARHV